MTKEPTGNPVGRPLKYKTVKELQAAIDEYFDYCDNRVKQVHSKEGESYGISDPEPYTMAGLAFALDLSRQALMEYSHKDEFGDAIKKARQKVEKDVERRLMEGKATTGAIFNLKNNFGWKDKTEVENSGEIRHKFEEMSDDELERAIQARKNRIA